MKRFSVLPALIGVVIFLGALVVSTSLFVVDEREMAVILQFGRPVRSIEEPGLYFKTPLIQEVRRIPKTLQFWRSDSDIVDLPTADGKKIEVAAWAIWRITDPVKFVTVLRTVENADLAINDRIRAAIRDEITAHDLSEVVRSTGRELTYSFRFELPQTALSGELPQETQLAQPGTSQEIEFGREKITAAIKESVQKRLAGDEDGTDDRGVELVDVGITSIGFVPAVREAAFERLKAFMESIASGYRSSGEQRKQEILNRTQAEVEKILGEGEQQSHVIRGQTDAQIIRDYASAIEETGDLYQFLKLLEVYENSLSGDTKLILTTNSELFRLLQKLDREQQLDSEKSERPLLE
ncbi:MAG: protease modulator HflC [Planctomycetaceae bacterium]|nr:protease modulator HflC [Planctomycetaceae bacterium]